jgi:hypothetical protein
MPDGRISQVRFEALAVSSVSLPLRHEVQALVRIRPDAEGFAHSLGSSPAYGIRSALSPTTALKVEPPSAQSPFAGCRRYRHPGDVDRLYFTAQRYLAVPATARFLIKHGLNSLTQLRSGSAKLFQFWKL